MKLELLNSLHTIDNTSLVDKVEKQLIELLLDKGLTIGDSIPKEIELSKSMGVSRTVIREALTRLKTRGIIKSIKHKGTIITSPNLTKILEQSVIPKILDDKTLKDMFELRLVLEIGMADLLFKNITSKDIDELEEIVKDEPETSKDILFSSEHEMKFHSKLYKISKNKTLINFQQMLIPVFDYVYKIKLLQKNKPKVSYISHKQLIEILKTGTPEDFREAMRKHLHNHFMRLGIN